MQRLGTSREKISIGRSPWGSPSTRGIPGGSSSEQYSAVTAVPRLHPLTGKKECFLGIAESVVIDFEPANDCMFAQCS